MVAEWTEEFDAMHKAVKTARIVPLETIKAKGAEAAYDKIRDYNGSKKFAKWCGRLRFTWSGWKLVLNDLKYLQSFLPTAGWHPIGATSPRGREQIPSPPLALQDLIKGVLLDILKCYHYLAKRASIRMLISSLVCWSTMWSANRRAPQKDSYAPDPLSTRDEITLYRIWAHMS